MKLQKKISNLITKTIQQRSLSHTIGINLINIIESRKIEEKKNFLNVLLKNLNKLKDTHNTYIHFDTEYFVLNHRISEIREILDEADLLYHQMQFQTDELVESRKYTIGRLVFESNYVSSYLKAEGDYSRLMDRLLEEYTLENQLNTNFQAKLEWAGYSVTIVVFFIMILFIFNPIQKKLFNTFQELWKANARLTSQNDDLELYRLMIEKNADPVFLLDMDEGFKMIFINEAAARHFGKSRAEILTWTLPDWDPNFTAKDLPAHYEKVKNQKAIVLETSHKSASGIIPVEVSANLIRYKNHFCHFGYFKDITNRKKSEDELIRAKEDAEIANRAKSDFLSSMSHEIRTPMNAVLGLTHLLKKTRINYRQYDYLEKIEGAGRSLLGIINDILDVSKVEAGQLTIEEAPFLFSEILKNLSAIFSVIARENDIEILFDIDNDMQDNYLGDSLRITQVLINMLNNAIKFTDHGEVILKLTSQEDAEESIIMKAEIKDSGIGMSPEQINKLFFPFQQADPSITRRFGGTGLGLFITKKLLELMGGTIQIQSQLGQGTEVYITIPLKKNFPRMLSCGQLPENFKNLHVLYADDSYEARKIMSNMFKSCGWKWELAASSSDAIEKVIQSQKSERFDLILLDVDISEKYGMETAVTILDIVKNEKKTLIMLVSTFSNSDLWEKIDGTGIGGILTKPLTMASMLEYLIPAISNEKRPDREIVIKNQYQGELSGIKILAVEDNQLNQEILYELVSDFGASISLADSAEDALNKIRKEKYNLVLMDIQMPGMDGYDACRRLKQIPEVKNIPVIALSANVLPEDVEKSRSAGMVDFIAKPVDVNDLFEKIKKWTD